jgi:hypothetical protein
MGSAIAFFFFFVCWIGAEVAEGLGREALGKRLHSLALWIVLGAIGLGVISAILARLT